MLRHLSEYLILALEEIERKYFAAWQDPSPYRERPRKKRLASPELRQKVFKRDSYACRYCGSRDWLEADHIIPEARGGKTTLDNLQALCRSCNQKKGVRIRREP